MGSSFRRWVCGIVVLAVVATTTGAPTVSGQATSGEKLLTRADAIADIEALFVALERIHPNPYFSRSRER